MNHFLYTILLLVVLLLTKLNKKKDTDQLFTTTLVRENTFRITNEDGINCLFLAIFDTDNAKN